MITKDVHTVMFYNKKYIITAQVTARCMYDLESEWPAHNQGKTLG